MSTGASIVRAVTATTMLFGLTVAVAEPQPQGEVLCNERRVTYSMPDPKLRSRIVLEAPAPGAKPLAGKGKRFPSPQGTRRLLVHSPDFTREGPWNTTIEIFGAAPATPSLRLHFRDHANGGVGATWINEKLVAFVVWWGRIVSTDLILDVERKTWLYEESADYGMIIQPCRGSDRFSFAGLSFESRLPEMRRRYPKSQIVGRYVYVADGESHDHIHGIEVPDGTPSSRLRIHFEERKDLREPPAYPRCSEIVDDLTGAYGPRDRVRRFAEEASRREDAIWEENGERLEVQCFRDADDVLRAEAVVITRPGTRP